MIETIGGIRGSERPEPRYRCTECGAERYVRFGEKDSPTWHNYDCPIQQKLREHKKLMDTFLKMNDDFPLLHFTVIDPRAFGYSDDPAEVQKLIDAIVEEINKELRKERA